MLPCTTGVAVSVINTTHGTDTHSFRVRVRCTPRFSTWKGQRCSMQPRTIPAWWPEHLEVADLTVDVSDLDAGLQAFLAAAAARHFTLFDLPLTVTSGNDGNHAQGSKHYEWKAVDLRSRDLSS